MKKTIIATSAATALLFAGALPALATTHKSPEELCKEQAAKHHVTAEKMDAYVKSCVEKHHKTHKTTTTPKPAAPAEPAK